MAEKKEPPTQGEGGRFVNGNSGGPGRPKGSSRQQLAREFVESMQRAWAEKGDEVLAKVIKDDPATFLRSMVAIMPKEVDLNINRYDEMTVEQLRAEFVAALRDARTLGIDLGAGVAPGLH